MQFKDFGFLFLFALIGALVYELIIYLFDPASIYWPGIITEVLVVSLLVSGILFVIKNLLSKKHTKNR